MIIAALDLSLTSTGFALAVDGKVDRHSVIPGQSDGMRRLVLGRNAVMAQIEAMKPSLVVIEELAFSMNKAYAKENAGFAFLIRTELFTDKIPFVVVASNSLKKWVCGKGSAPKELMIKEIFRRFGHDVDSNDEADAIGLAYIGMALAGEWEPQIEAQREVLATLRKSNPWLSSRYGVAQ